jgi:hypothetical protein
MAIISEPLTASSPPTESKTEEPCEEIGIQVHISASSTDLVFVPATSTVQQLRSVIAKKIDVPPSALRLRDKSLKADLNNDSQVIIGLDASFSPFCYCFLEP